LTYTLGLERGDINYPELAPIYARHYAEMQARLEAEGHTVSPYNPQLDRYFPAFRDGWLLNFVARHDGKAVGYCNIYLTIDAHNGDPIAREDVLYVLPEHRNGLGRKLVLFVLENLRARGVKRGFVTPTTDPRVGKAWKRMGFKSVAELMVYHF
jgi:GNAT superfamily N-acetyltransferase